MAITNSADSPLAEAAEYVLDIKAGKEEAVAATKTYTAQLLAVAMLSAALTGDEARFEALSHLPDYVEEVLALEPHIERIVERFYYMALCVVLGRGYNYATAYEWSLKLKELAYVVAEPYSSADFMHGPIAIVEQNFPIMAVLPSGAVYQDLLAVVKKLSETYQAELLVISNQDEALDLGSTQLRLPSDVPEWISPLVSIVPAQLFCYHLTRIKGFDTESPRGLKKVTETR